ncbi:MAG: hypothetical protein K1060chlam3_00169 [Candidatus Anoxychlamydiales bacterium]|nr:hypothetical protein [Candidatus Anoxychlamydiales bacterium]
MLCFAIFSLKYPSFLTYDIEMKNVQSVSNLKSLYFVENPPSDTYMRQRIGDVNPNLLRSAFKKNANLQREKMAIDLELHFCEIFKRKVVGISKRYD